MSRSTLDRDRFETIEAYVLGRMSTADRERFEQDLAADPQLQAEVDMQRENTWAVELAGMARLVKDAGVQQADAIPGSGGAWRPALRYAAIIAVLLGSAYFWLARPASNERLYAEYHVVDPGLPVPMSATNDPVFHDAMVAFKLGEFDEARNKWATLLLASPANDTLLFYIGCADLERGRTEEAIGLFKGIAQDTASTFHGKARWYLFLAYLLRNDADALRAMDMGNDPIYGDRVRAILSDLPS